MFSTDLYPLNDVPRNYINHFLSYVKFDLIVELEIFKNTLNNVYLIIVQFKFD